MTPDGPAQAPAYDVVCSSIYTTDEISQNLAMAVGDAFGLEELSALEWAQFCALTGINPTLVRREIERGVKAITNAIDYVAAETIDFGADRAVIEAITAVVERESARQLEFAPAIREMMDWV
jgi:hypothetical protein